MDLDQRRGSDSVSLLVFEGNCLQAGLPAATYDEATASGLRWRWSSARN